MLRRYPTLDPQLVAEHFAFNLAAHQIPKANKLSFIQKFAPKNAIFCPGQSEGPLAKNKISLPVLKNNGDHSRPFPGLPGIAVSVKLKGRSYQSSKQFNMAA